MSRSKQKTEQQQPPRTRRRRPRPTSYLYAGMLSLLRRGNSVEDLEEELTDTAPPPRRRRILILMSDTGGGHRASAEAIKAALEDLYPDQVAVAIVDFFVDLAGPPWDNYPRDYAFVAAHPPLWRVIYHLTSTPLVRWGLNLATDVSAADRIRAAFIRYDPDLVISVHPMIQELTRRVLYRNARYSNTPRPPFVTVITDLGAAHPMWFNAACDRIYLPSPHIRQTGTEYGIPERVMRQYGLPVRPDFWVPLPQHPLELPPPVNGPAVRERVRKELGLVPFLPMVLLVGGGDGVGALGQTVKAVASRLARDRGPHGAQLVVVCGRNARLREDLEERRWQVPVYVRGFVRNMSDFMKAADMIVTKAGPGTIAEALIRELPIIVSSFLPGQEKGNVDFVVENGVGANATSPEDIAALVSGWLGDEKLLMEMRDRARALAKPEATRDIARDAFEVCIAHEDRRAVEKKAGLIRTAQTHEEPDFLLGVRMVALFRSIPSLLGNS